VFDCNISFDIFCVFYVYDVCDSYSCFVQSDVAINIFCQDQLPVIIGFVLLNTNVIMRIFFVIFFGFVVHNFLSIRGGS